MTGSITARTIGEYLDTLGSSDPTPGGGSVAGVVGALGCSLGRMVIALTKPDSVEVGNALDTAGQQLANLQEQFTELSERDESAYQGFRDAAALPKSSPDDKSRRKQQMQDALKSAASVPFDTAAGAVKLVELLGPVREFGNPYLLSDAQIALLCASTCFDAARINVEVNLAMIRDEDFVADITAQLNNLAVSRQKLMDSATSG